MALQGRRKVFRPAIAAVCLVTSRQAMAGNNRRSDMKIVVIGGSGLIGSKLVRKLREKGHEVVAASPNIGRQYAHRRRTGRGAKGRAGRRRRGQLALVRRQGGAGFLRDLRPQPARRGSGRRRDAITSRCRSSAPSACPTAAIFRAKLAQEKLIKASGIPYTILRSTQFFEFIGGIVQIGRRRRRDPPVARLDAADRLGRRRRRAGRSRRRHRR